MAKKYHKKQKVIENLKVNEKGLNYDTKIKETLIVENAILTIKYLKP